MASSLTLAALLLFIGISLCTALTPDLDLAKKIEESLDEDEFVIELKDIKPKKRSRNSIETIFTVDFTGSAQKWSVLLDRIGEQVIVEAAEQGILETAAWKLSSLGPGAVLKHLMITIKQKAHGADIGVYQDCDDRGKKTMPSSLRDMFGRMKNPQLQLVREKRYGLKIAPEQSIDSVITDRCGLDQMQAQQPSSNDINAYRRGDIPIFHDCDDRDGLLAKTLNALIELIKQLRQDIEYQRGEIQYLRSLLERCDICARGGSSDSLVRHGCNSDPPPCFHGVECRDTVQGPQCGRCPRGYVGDGRTCKPGLTCEDRPCFPAVRCYDTVEGFQCGPCPAGYSGDGQRCKPRGGCDLAPCHPVPGK